MKYLIVIALFFIVANLHGQDTRKYSVSKSSASLLDKVDITQPKEATDLIGEVLRKAKKDKDLITQGKCYVLLAQVYESINEMELAADRRLTAIRYYQQAGENEMALVQTEALGRIYLNLNNLDKAKSYFQICHDNTNNTGLSLRCKEGLADAYRKAGEDDISLKYYEDLDKSYKDQNFIQSNSRIKAKKANVYANQKDQEKALLNYNMAQSNYSKEATREDLVELEDVKEKLITNDPKLEMNLRSQNIDLQSTISPVGEFLIDEKIKVTENLIAAGKIGEAEKMVAEVKKDYVGNPSTPNSKTIFKLSADINGQKGDYEKALSDLNVYEKLAKEDAEEKSKEQEQLIAILKSQREIDLSVKDFTIEANKAAYRENQLHNRNAIIGLLSLLLVGAMISFYFIYKNIQARRKANQILQLKSLRAQMNPHFIFNVLNSVNNFISKNDDRSANKYLADFSKLMRVVLQDSQKDLISMEEELTSTELYLKLEHSRFTDQFDYEIHVDKDCDLKDFNIPPMMIQPFIENAVWHGLRYKEEKGFIKLLMKQAEDILTISIADNGIGRAKSKMLKTKTQKEYKSTGLKNVQSRIQLINKLYAKDYQINIQDLNDGEEDTGTLVVIKIPA
jgi:hypothetical protein